MVVRLTGPLGRAVLGEGLRVLVTRHEALRTTFCHTAAGPAQVVCAPADPPLTEADVRRRLQEYIRLPAELTARLFPLTEVPLRLPLARTKTEERRLRWAVHHALFDSWSMGVLLKEFLAHDRALTRGVPPPRRRRRAGPGSAHADAARRAGGAGRERAVEFWRGRVSGLEDLRLREPDRARRTSLFPLLLAALVAVAHADTGQPRFLLSASVATGRSGAPTG